MEEDGSGHAAKGPNCIKGLVNGKRANILLDSGAQCTMVKAGLVQQQDYTGEFIRITTFLEEQPTLRPLADITIVTDTLSLKQRAAVMADDQMRGPEDVLLSVMLGSTEKMTDILVDGESVISEANVVVINATRAQKRANGEQEEAVRQQEALDELRPTTIDEVVRAAETGRAAAYLQEEESEEEEELATPNPTLINTTAQPGGIPSAEIQAETKTDDTLRAWRDKADEARDGFYWEKGLLKRRSSRDWKRKESCKKVKAALIR